MAPKREHKKRLGKKHRQASTRPKLGKAPRAGARTGAQIAGAAPKQRKSISAKKAAATKKAKTPRRSPEFERKVTLAEGAGGRGESGKKQIPFGDDKKKGNNKKNNNEKDDNKKSKGTKQSARSSQNEMVRPARMRPLLDEDRELEALANEMGRASRGASREAAEMPLVAICGRPNVGKSTLFNRLTGTRRSIVGDEPGITRDRIYGEVEWNGRTVRLVDTGGVIPDDEALIPSEIFRQAQVALAESDAVIMVIDGRTEITAADMELSRLLLRAGGKAGVMKPLFLAVNKMDSAELEAGAENFRTLGFRNVMPISAEHGSGIGDLLDEVWAVLPAQHHTDEAAEDPDEVLDSLNDEAEEDEGGYLADRATLEPRTMGKALLHGEAATADEPAGEDAPPIGEVDFDLSIDGMGDSREIQGSLHSGLRPPFEMTSEKEWQPPVEMTSEKEWQPSVEMTPQEGDPGRRLRSHGEHISRETKIAIIGRPNVGKSTLLNALTGSDRAIVSPIAGTTRDAVDEVVRRDGHDFRFIDTAGIRRKGKTKLLAEKLSVIMSRKHLEAADVALLVIDATEGVAAADANIGGYAHESGRSVIVIINKWDLMTKTGPDGKRLFDGKPPADKKVYEQQVRDSLKYLDYAPLLFVSASESKGIEEVFKKVELVARERRKRVSTGQMNRFLDRIDFQRASVPMNKRVKIYYMTQAAVAPPTFVLFTDRDVKLHFSYERFLANEIRDSFKFIGSPIWFKVKARNKKKAE